MREYATKEATTEVLLDIGFKQQVDGGKHFDSPGKDRGGNPVVKAVWDITEPRKEFTDWLDLHFPNWK